MPASNEPANGRHDASGTGGVKVRVVDYVNAGAKDVREVGLMAEILGDDEERDIRQGAIIMLMTANPRDPNRTIKDLMAGADGFDVPQCLPGSEVEFTGIKAIAYDGITYADGFQVLEAVPETAPGL